MPSSSVTFAAFLWRLFLLLITVLGVMSESSGRSTNCYFFINNNGDYPQKKTANCIRKKLTDVPPCSAVGYVSSLDLTGNKIENLHEASFLTWTHLEELTVAENKIVAVTERAFRPLSKLRRLNLMGNNIGLPHCMPASVFKSIPNLQFLDLSYNPIFQIPNRFFSRLDKLQELRIRNAKQNMKLHPYSFAGLHQLKVLDLTDNGLQRLPSTGMKECLTNMSLERLLLGGANRWQCDCKMRWLKMWQVQRGGLKPSYKSETINEKREKVETEPICDGPSLVQGRALFGPMIQITDFQCLPVVRNKPARYVRPMRSNLTLHCIIYSDPKGPVSWYKDGILVQKHWNRAKVSQSQGVEFRAELLIVDLRPTDSGEWVCLAQNRRGRASANFTVEVVVPGHSSQTLTRIIIYCGIGAVGALLLCVGIGLVAYCLNCRRKDYRGYNKGTAGASAGAMAETRRLHTPTDAANPATDESDYEPATDHNGPPPPPPPPPQALAGPMGPSMLDGGVTLPGRKSSQQQALMVANLSGPGATLDRKAATLRLEKVPLTSTVAQQDPNSNTIAGFTCATTSTTLPRPQVALSPQQQTPQQRDTCPVHGTPTGGNYRADGHYSPCPVHGDATLAAAAVARNSIGATGSTGAPSSGAAGTAGAGGGGHNNPLYGTMPASGRYKPCPLHGDMYATLQTRQGATGGAAGHHHAGLQSPSQGSNASSTTVALQTIMRSKDNNEGAHATYIRASRVDDCIGGSPSGGAAGAAATSASGGPTETGVGPVNGVGTLAKTKPQGPNAAGPKPLEDEGYSTSV